MELVAGTCALIMDLRSNGGSSPYGVALWCSYLIAEPTHAAYGVAYTKALRHVLELGDVPPPIADEARDTFTTLTG